MLKKDMNIIKVYKKLTVSQLFYIYHNNKCVILIIGDYMRIEKWKYKDEEIEVPLLEKDEIETNEVIENLEDTIDLTKTLENIEDENDK